MEVFDANGCMDSINVTVTEPDEQLSLRLDSSSNLACNQDNSVIVTDSRLCTFTNSPVIQELLSEYAD